MPAKIAQHFGGAPLADAHTDCAFVEPCLVGGQAGHWREVCKTQLGGGSGDLLAFAVCRQARPTVEGLLIGVVELEVSQPRFTVIDALDGDLD